MTTRTLLKRPEPFESAILIPGSKFEADGTPSANMLARMSAAAELIRVVNSPTILLSSGGARGAESYRNVDPHATEASLIAAHLRKMGIRESIICEPFAEESFGNVIFSILILEKLGCRRLYIVTQYWHGLRLQKLFDWLASTLFHSYVVTAPCFLSERDRIARTKADYLGGFDFLIDFFASVPPGDVIAAFGWIKKHHRMQYYRNMDIHTIDVALAELLADSQLGAIGRSEFIDARVA